MKSLSSIVLSCAVVSALAGVAVAQSHDHDHDAPATNEAKHANHDGNDDMDVRTVTGEVIDITCYVRHDSKGPKHVKCATVCANLGMPLGILEDGTDKIFLILPAGHAAPLESVDGFLGQHVTAKLMLFPSGGLLSAEVMEIAAVVPK